MTGQKETEVQEITAEAREEQLARTRAYLEDMVDSIQDYTKTIGWWVGELGKKVEKTATQKGLTTEEIQKLEQKLNMTAKDRQSLDLLSEAEKQDRLDKIEILLNMTIGFTAMAKAVMHSEIKKEDVLNIKFRHDGKLVVDGIGDKC